jgi:secondary thiamine-phosphate synthase enzyme
LQSVRLVASSLSLGRCFLTRGQGELHFYFGPFPGDSSPKCPGGNLLGIVSTGIRFLQDWPQRFSTMKSLTEHLWFEVPGRRGFVNITGTIEGLVRKSGVREGLCLVNAMHITASVFINDAEDGLLHDYDVWLEKLAPHAPTSQYQHNRTGEDNADAHMKRQVMGREVVVAITNGKLDFGPWEQIFYGEFDGNRRKRVLVKIIGE